MPDPLEEGVLYVSIPFALASHRCCCGCGCEVVTPLSPTDWMLIFDGETISLFPSIGNWGFPCKSHYWIENNSIAWAEEWSDDKINAERRRDRVRKRLYYRDAGNPGKTPSAKAKHNNSTGKKSLWSKLRRGMF